MKISKWKKIRNIFARLFVLVVVLVLFFTIPMLRIGVETENFSLIFGTFLGEKSKYQGIIEIWNIDTFESGSVSKTNFLLSASKIYQKKNKGIYFMVRNMTEQECLYSLENGEVPDLFSCSYGVSNAVKSYLKPYNQANGLIRSEFENAGKINDDLYGLAWCRGCYFLISTSQKLKNAKVDDNQQVSLLNLALNVGYEIKRKNSTKTIYSLGLGAGKYGMPQQVFKSYNIKGESSKNENSINLSLKEQSGYLAYSRFVAEESVVLLGTQRDVVRMENRVSQQKIEGVIYQPLPAFCDLVQFMFLGNPSCGERAKYAEDFAKFLVSDQIQKRLGSINMFSVKHACADDYELGVMKDIIHEINENCEVFNVFLSKQEIDELRK